MTLTTTSTIAPNGDILLRFPSHGDDTEQSFRKRKTPIESPTTPTEASSSTDGPAEPDKDQRKPFDLTPLHKEAIHLQVSSSVLSLISPVFNAMLNGSMAEATAFRAPKSPRPFPIDLPEDDGVAFTLLADIAHHRTDRVPELPPLAILLSLAALADKYMCTSALAPYGTLWLQKGVDTMTAGPDEISRLCRLMVFAYVVDLPAPFARIGRKVLLAHRQDPQQEIETGTIDLPIPPNYALFKHDLIGHLFRKKLALRRAMNIAIMDPVSQVTRELVYNSRTPPCRNVAECTGLYMAILDRYNLCSWRPQFETDSLGAVLDRMKQMSTCEKSPGLVFGKCNAYNCSCFQLRQDFSTHLGSELGVARERLMKGGFWPCLDCLKRLDGDETPCRVPHP